MLTVHFSLLVDCVLLIVFYIQDPLALNIGYKNKRHLGYSSFSDWSYLPQKEKKSQTTNDASLTEIN